VVGYFHVAAAGRRPARLTNMLPALPVVSAMALKAVAHDPRQIVPADARHVIRTALGASHPLRVLMACARSIPAPGLDTIDAPVHLVFADKDVVIPPRLYAPYFTDRLPHAKVTTLEGVGHCPQVEVPGLVAEMIDEFVVATTEVAATA
jgi:pimeloyl-ACP methyl ester carboxylesterase